MDTRPTIDIPDGCDEDVQCVPNETGCSYTRLAWNCRSLHSLPHQHEECRSRNVRNACDHLFPSDATARSTVRFAMPCSRRSEWRADTWLVFPPHRYSARDARAFMRSLPTWMGWEEARFTVAWFRFFDRISWPIPPRHEFLCAFSEGERWR